MWNVSSFQPTIAVFVDSARPLLNLMMRFSSSCTLLHAPQMGGANGPTGVPPPPTLPGPLLVTTWRLRKMVTRSQKKAPVGPGESGKAADVMFMEMPKCCGASAGKWGVV